MALLPFLKKKDSGMGGVLTIDRKPDGDVPPGDPAAEACAQDIINAINSKDAKGLASALKAAFEIFDSQPHEEGPHIGEEGLE